MQLKPFQITGATFLAARTRALLADEPGVGKTPQLCTAARLVQARTGLVVCPDIAIEHWLRELKKWGVTRPHHDFRVISWGQAHEFCKRRGHLTPWDVLIPDECHFGKNPQAKRAKAVFGTGGLGWYARRVWAASGTPAPNNVSELWPMLRAFGKIGMDHDSFTRYFCHVDQNGKVRGNRADHVAELRAILESFTLRRKKRDVLPELGEIDIQEWYVKPSPAFLAGFGTDCAPLEARLRAELEKRTPEDLLTFLAGHEEFATLRRYNALLKAPAVFETIKFEIENGLLDKVVVFGYHREAMLALHDALKRACIATTLIFGDTPRGDRDALIEEWKRGGRVLIASTIIASTALDFTAAHQGVMLELDYVPGNNLQAMQRMHRHGQENPVTVRVAIGTPIDEIVSNIVLQKTRNLAEVFG